MNRLEYLKMKLEGLPRGYISIKEIKGKKYHYNQYLSNGKLVSKYIPNSKLEEFKEKLYERKKIEYEIDYLRSSGKKLPTLSTNAKELTGYLMCEDTVVAEFKNGECTYIDEKRAPLLIKRTHNLIEFLKGRVIDESRVNSRLLKKFMEIKETKKEDIALRVYGKTITDSFWFKPKFSKLNYCDIEFKDDFYDDLSLNGTIAIIPKSPRYSPQLTAIGSYEKCWKIIDGKWWLYKKGTDREIFSEMFCYKLAKALGIDTAIYETEKEYIRSLDFSSGYNFEPISSIAGDDDSYDNVFNSLSEYSFDIQRDYIRLIMFDTIVNNVDRHNENCGLLRDIKSGEVLKLAPNFDNNLALISRQSITNTDPKLDGFVSYFIKFIKQNKQAQQIFKTINLNKIDNNIIKKISNEINPEVDSQLLEKYIMNRINYLESIKQQI